MSKKLFTIEEDNFLKENYSILSNAELEHAFEYKHTRDQIKWRAKSLGLNKVPATMARINATKAGTWSEEEKDTLRLYYPRGGVETIVQLLGRSKSNVRHKAFRMGIHLDYDIFCARHANGPKTHSDEAKRKMSLAGKGRKFSEEHRRKIGDAVRGEKNYNWKGGRSFIPYPREFNDKLRRRIKKRDYHQCVLCDSKKRLVIHHIDENKENCEDSNLITLCMACHNTYHFTKDINQQQLMQEFFCEHAGRTS